MAAGASVLTISAGGAAIYSKYIHRRPPPFIARARTRMGYLLRDKYARRPHECNAAAVRSTHESARARAHSRTRATCIHKAPDIWRARARDSPPPRRHFSSASPPFLPWLAQPFASFTSLRTSFTGWRTHSSLARRAEVYFHRFAKTENKSFHLPIIFASRGFIVCVSIHLD